MSRLLLATVLAAAAQRALSQTIPVDYPDCAQPCIDDLTYPSLAGCQATDGNCLCMSPDYIHMVSCCMSSNCDSISLQTSFDTAESVCLTWGVSLTVDRSPTCDEVTSTTTSSAPTETATEESSSGGGSSKKNKSKKKKKGGKKSFGVGGIAGVAVAAVVIVGALLFAIILCLKRRRDQKKGAYSSVAQRQLHPTPIGGATGGFTDKTAQSQVAPVPDQQGYAPPPQYTPQPYAPYSGAAQAPPTPQPQPQQMYAQYGVPQAPTPQPQTMSPPVAHPSVPEMYGAEVNRAPSPLVSPIPVSPQPAGAAQSYYGTQFPAPGSGQRPAEVP